MKLIRRVVAGCLLSSGLLFAAPPTCVTGTLASYIALGSKGCTFDGNVLANFAYSAGASGKATKIRADQIEVTPLLIVPETAEFSFTAPWSAGTGDAQDSTISYTAVLPCGDMLPTQLRLMLGPVHVGGNIGSVTIEESTNVGKLSVFDRCVELCQIKASDSLDFNPVSVVLISDHVTLIGGFRGVSVSKFASSLNRCIPCVGP